MEILKSVVDTVLAVAVLLNAINIVKLKREIYELKYGENNTTKEN